MKNERVYIVGGGAKNSLLNQFAAEATGLPVIAGPIEATAIGNILIQAKALGIIESLNDFICHISSYEIFFPLNIMIGLIVKMVVPENGRIAVDSNIFPSVIIYLINLKDILYQFTLSWQPFFLIIIIIG